MADYTIRVEADTRDSQKKVDDLDKRLNEVEKPRKIDIHIPSLQDSINGVKTLGEALKTAFNAARMIPGNPINDLEQVGDIVGEQAKKVVSAVALISKATPTNILGNSFNVASESAVTLSKNVASLGYTVFGVTQSVNILKSAFGGFFDETIGREIKLQETLLRTKTTLVSTADVAVNGKRLTDPYEAILKLEKPIEKTVENIRLRSLDIAGTTSEAIIQTFGVVAGQIGQIGGSMKDAEDLAISFAGALGTLGLSDPMYATQEIRSILTGNIDQNSVLARSLGLTNEEVAKAKKSADGLVGYLQKRLEAFTAGQSIAAKGFAGITSNIQEVQQELSRVFGKPFLQPMLDGLTKVYERLQLVTASLKKTREGNPIPGPAVGIADALGRTGNAVVTGVAGAALQAPSLTKVTQRAQYEGFERLEKVLADVFLKIQAAIDKMRPQITLLAEEAVRAGTEIVKGLGALAAGFAQFKFENFKYFLTGWIGLARLLNDTVVPAVSNLLRLYGALFSNEFFQGLSQFVAQWQMLEKAGILPAVRGIQSLISALSTLWPLFAGIPKVVQWIGGAISNTFNLVIAGIARLSSAFTAFALGAVELITLLTRWVSTLAVVVARDAGLALVQLANWLRATYPELARVALGVSAIGRAFMNLATGIQVAQAQVAKFAVQSAEYLASLELSTEKLKLKFAELNASIQAGLGKAKNAFLGVIGSIVKFFAIQLAIQAAITVAMDAYTKAQERQQQIADKTRAELAIRRLSTAYKDLGDNATLAAKKAKEFEDAIVSNRLSEVTKKIEELSNKIREFEAKSAASKKDSPIDRVRRSLFDFSTWKTSKELESVMTAKEKADLKAGKQPDTNMLAARAELQRLNAERKKLAQEAQTLLKYQEKADADKQSKEQVDILGKERKQLEKELADYRKQLNKEITDNEFNFRQERLQIEQTAREAQRASESAALGRSIEASLQGLSGYRQQMAQILGDYQKRLFDAQTESQKRQFDLARQKEKMEKNLSDYKLKLEEQTAKLKLKITDYSAKMTKWENEERLKTSRAILQYALKAGEAYTGKFTLLPEDRTRFLDAAAARGVSAERMLAIGKTLKDGEIPSNSSPEALFDYVQQFLPKLYQTALKDTQEGPFLEELTKRTSAFQLGAGRYALESASTELGSSFWKKFTPAAPPQAPGLQSVIDENTRALRSYQQNQEAIYAQTVRMVELQDKLAKEQNAAILEAQIRAMIFEGRRLPSTVDNELQGARLQNSARIISIQAGGSKLDPYEAQKADTLYRAQSMIDIAIRKANQTDRISFTPDKLLERINKWEAEGAITNKPQSYTDKLMINAANLTISRLSNDKYNRESERGLAAQKSVGAILDQLADLPDKFQTASVEMIQKMQAALIPTDPVSRRRFETESQITMLRNSDDYKQFGAIPAYKDVFDQFTSYMRLASEKLGQLDKAIEAFITKLALIKDTAATLTEGFKTSFKNLLNGQITGFDEMMKSIRDKFTNAFADWIFKPIQDSIEKELKRWFNVDNEAQQLADLQKQYTEEFKTAVANFGRAVDTFSGKPSPEEPAPGTPAPGTVPSPEPAPLPGSPPSAGPVPIPNVPYAPDQSGASAIGGAAAYTPEVDYAAITQNVNQTAQALGNLAATAAQTPAPVAKATDGLQNFLGGLATVAAGIAGIVSGIQQLGKKDGGTANTLMGLSNIFIGLGTTLIGGGKLFKAAGGPVSAGSPYIVGEQGPEWFVPSRSGNILPNGVGIGGAGSPVSSVVNVHISDSGTRTDNNQASQLGRMIDSAVINVINRERRTGGLLATR